MILRLSKISLLMAVALYYLIVAFNNLTDYDSNYQFVHHVLLMDSTFPGNHGLWHALPQPGLQRVFYWSIIAWESLTCILCCVGSLRLIRALKASGVVFQRAKSMGIAALTLGCLLWFVAFLTVGGEWFLMWQSRTWNGEDAAFRMFASLGIVLVYLSLPEPANCTCIPSPRPASRKHPAHPTP
jgi:predicted small integral membrane protein